MKPDFDDDEYKGSSIDPKEFDLFEKRTGYKIPDQYRTFLLEQNGGYLKRYKDENEDIILAYPFKYYDGKKEFAYIDYFEQFKANNESKYFFLTSHSWEEEFYGSFGKAELCIGSDSSNGNPVTVTLSNDGYGEIYFWDHESNNNDPRKDRAKIANSFEEFINGFEYIPIDEL